MAYKVLIYCPDAHIRYTAQTPEKEGVGGGVTARIRLAQALAGLGHEVTVLSNVPHAHESKGAQFIPLGKSGVPRDVDVLVMTTSGDRLSLLPAKDLPVKARLREAWVHGTIPVAGWERVDADYVVAVSNFIREVARDEWGVPEEDLFVIYNGYTKYPEMDVEGGPPERDPYALTYTSHPSKGLDAARGVLRILRERDERFTLHVYGGYALWGEDERPMQEAPGVEVHGLVGQERVAHALRKANVSLHLQSRLEPFALSLVEALGYGCIPIVSPVGGNREAVQDGYNGFWVEGDHRSEAAQRKAADLIYALVQEPDFADYLRKKAMNIPWTWEAQARAWAAHWRWVLEGEGETLGKPGYACPACGGPWLLAADGYHCLSCGRYSLVGR